MMLILSLLQQMSVFLVIAYLFSKSPLFRPMANYSMRLPHKLLIYFVFSGFCIMGSYFGLAVQDAIANTRAVGAVLGGLLGGPVIGFLVGLTGGLHRYSMGGFTDLACAISTTLEGLLGGLVHYWLVRKGDIGALFSPRIAFFTTLAAEALQMGTILLVARPFEQAWALVQVIALPMLLANATGAALFISMIRDQKTMREEFSSAYSARALAIARRTVGIMARGFGRESAEQICRILHQEIGVAAVAITDREKILAFTGLGHEHHRPGTPISSALTLEAIADQQVKFADGYQTPYACSLAADCKLGSVLVIPIKGCNGILGTIKLYEPKKRLFLKINRTLGEGIAELMAHQILSGQLERQQQLLTQAELKLVHAQVNPHFLFNALNTIGAIIRLDPDKARALLLHLSHFFRKNLKRSGERTTLKEELEHVQAYLAIEQARFSDRLRVGFDVPEALLGQQLPTFTLQPIIENAIKHGTSTLLEQGDIRVAARREGEQIRLRITDNAGNYQPAARSDGLGLGLVDKRVKSLYGDQYGVQIECEPEQWTRVTVSLPVTEDNP
ncbi:histidine kinase [Zobellella denitrificans]|uniref:histidine kinase n=1 Tax=Zobellella denitrificans TaxID=347534 RepID=A0A291HMY0_9GAMM|nr:sensor histidine kinase [Zobellella denitrificans]ATG73431.1 histidine kinase [Zobellella denitrificans]